MNVLDGVLLLVGVLALLLGWRLGLVCGLISTAAVILGGAAGFLVGRQIGAAVDVGKPETTLIVMACAVAGITIAQLLTSRPSQRLHEAVEATPLRRLNSAAGSVLTLGFAVAVVWMLATALALAPATGLAPLMRGSAVLVGMDRTVPADAGPLLHRLEVTASGDAGRGVFTGLGLLPAPAVELPDPGLVDAPAQQVAQESVVRIMGHAECGSTLVGSGVVIAEDLVITNAHVIAGIPAPYVFSDGRRIGDAATPVAFDPATDTAVLRVPGLDLPPVALSPGAADGDLVAVAGYPQGGPLSVSAARIRGSVTATGTDIYGTSQAKREVMVIAGDVLPGDSGGALLSADGQLVAVVFAAAVGGDGHTGYALTLPSIKGAIAKANEGIEVSTGPCVAAEGQD